MAEMNPVPDPIDVLLVDDHHTILAGVTALIESEAPRMRVAGRATTGHEALALAAQVRPHIIVLDVDLGGEDGLALIPGLQAACRAAIVVFSAMDDMYARQRAHQLGACCFIDKSAPGTELLDALHASIS